MSDEYISGVRRKYSFSSWFLRRAIRNLILLKTALQANFRSFLFLCFLCLSNLGNDSSQINRSKFHSNDLLSISCILVTHSNLFALQFVHGESRISDSCRVRISKHIGLGLWSGFGGKRYQVSFFVSFFLPQSRRRFSTAAG